MALNRVEEVPLRRQTHGSREKLANAIGGDDDAERVGTPALTARGEEIGAVGLCRKRHAVTIEGCRHVTASRNDAVIRGAEDLQGKVVVRLGCGKREER